MAILDYRDGLATKVVYASEKWPYAPEKKEGNEVKHICSVDGNCTNGTVKKWKNGVFVCRSYDIFSRSCCKNGSCVYKKEKEKEVNEMKFETIYDKQDAMAFIDGIEEDGFDNMTVAYREKRICKNCGQDVYTTTAAFNTGEKISTCLVCEDEVCVWCGTDGCEDIIHIAYKDHPRKDCLEIYKRIRKVVK